MPEITANKEVLWRLAISEYGIVNVNRVTVLTDFGDDDMVERHRRWTITPDDDIATLEETLGIPAGVANRLRPVIEAARYPEAIARYEAAKANGVIFTDYLIQ